MTEKEQFVRDLYPAAQRVSAETGMSSALILAQAAQETGWGQKMLPGTNNIFNIKADDGWQGRSRTFNVSEFENGKLVWKDEPFRVYDSWEEALRDRVAFLRENPRYAAAGLFDKGTKGDLKKEAEALQSAGYATDPHYAERLVSVFNGPSMQRAIGLARTIGSDSFPGVLRLGARGEVVRTIQSDLEALGYSDAEGSVLRADGHFGPATRDAIRSFQLDRGLEADGIVGSVTFEAIRQRQQQLLSHASLSQELEGWDPSHRVLTPSASKATGTSYADTDHPDHGLLVEIKQRIPDASDDRLTQFVAACHMGGIRPGCLGDIYINRQEVVFCHDGLGVPARVDLRCTAPPSAQTMGRVQAFDSSLQGLGAELKIDGR